MSFTPPIIAPTVFLEITGTMAATLPVVQFSNDPPLNAELTLVTASIEAYHGIMIDAALPVVEMESAGVAGTAMDVVAKLTTVDVALAGGAFSIDAALTTVEASVDAMVGNLLNIDGRLPLLEDSMAGDVWNLLTINARLPRPSSSLAALRGNLLVLDADLTKTRALLDGHTGRACEIDAELTAIAASLVVFQRVEGSVSAHMTKLRGELR
jgi:hypothetical protein